MRRKKRLGRFFRAPIYLYRWGLGGMLGKRFLLLIHTGRRTGHRHETVLEIMEYRADGPEAVVMSGFGRNADWFLNIQANPDEEVVIGTRHFAAKHRILPAEEALGVLRGYVRRNRFMAPVIGWVLSRLLGWRYRGSESDERRLVGQLPFIAFRPR